MFELKHLLFFGLGLLLAVPLIFVLLLKRLSMAKKSVQEPFLTVNPEDWAEEFIQTMEDKLMEAMEVSTVLDELFVALEKVFSFYGAGYILANSSEFVFKASLSMGVSQKYVANMRSNLIDYCQQLTKTTCSITEEFTVGAPLNEDSTVEVKASLLVPIYIMGSPVGVFGLFSAKKNAYSNVEKEFLTRALAVAVDYVAQLQKIVSRENEKLQAMIDSLSDGVLLIDKNLKVLVSNPEIGSVLKLATPNPNIMDITEYFASALHLENKILEVLATGSLESIAGINIGNTYYKLVLAPVKSADRVIGVGVIIHDETKEVELERMRREFSAMVIHDLRAPLSVIRGTAELLIGRAEQLAPEQVSNFLSQIRSSAADLLGMVNDLLDVAKVEEGKIELFKSTVDLNKLFSDQQAYYSTWAQQQGVQIDLDLDSDIGMADCDEKKIKQVMANLLSNAIKFTESGGHIGIISRALPGFAEISVWDTGKGMSADLKAHIFEKFVQGIDAKQKGTGLGLVIAKGIIEAHGGKIRVEDNQPKGAKFVFTLPRKS